MSTLQTGRTTPKNRFELTTGVGANFATSFFGSAIDAGKSAAAAADRAIDKGETPGLSPAEKRDIMRAAFTYSLVGVSPLWEIGVRYGILERWDAGAAYASSAYRLETKVQILRENLLQADDEDWRCPFDLSIGLQAQRQVFDFSLPDTIKDVFDIEDMERTDLTIPVIVSRHFGEYGFIYSGGKFVRSFLQADILERISGPTGSRIGSTRDMQAVGGFIGGGVGYKYLFLLMEFNVLRYSYKPELLGESVDLSGWNFYPAIGLKVNFYGSQAPPEGG